MTFATFLLRVLDGSHHLSSFQDKAIRKALEHYKWFDEYTNLGVKVVVEKVTSLDIKDKFKDISSFEQILDWTVEDSEKAHVDAYTLSCHTHQGFKDIELDLKVEKFLEDYWTKQLDKTVVAKLKKLVKKH